MSGRVVFVTGGSRGIGLACAQRLQEAGDSVALTYRTGPPNDLEGKEGTSPLRPYSCDVTSPADLEATFSAVEKDLGPVEVLICSAGITDDSLLLRMSEERWDRVIATDLTACYRAANRAVGPMIKARRGRIVLISSVVALYGNAGQTNYAAAKAGLIGFGRSLAREVASRSITVNIVAPGFVATDMVTALGEEKMALAAESVPLGRLGLPDEIAATVAFLCSADAAYITGALIPIDGGLGMGH